MGTIEIKFRISEDDPRALEIIRILQSSVPKKEDSRAHKNDEGDRQAPPKHIKLLLEYQKRGGRVGRNEIWVVNAAAYPDPRGAGGMYTKAAGYIDLDQKTQSYVLTEKARRALEEYEQREVGR